MLGTLVDHTLNVTMECSLVSAEPGFFRVLTQYEIDKGTDVTLSFGLASVRAEAVFCSPSGGQFLIGLTLRADERGHDRRREPRVPVDWPGTLIELNGPEPTTPTRLVNFSPSGIAVECAREIPLGATVAVDVEVALLFGEVCYSKPMPEANGSYVSGIRLAEVFAKSGATGTNAGFGRFWRNLVSQRR